MDESMQLNLVDTDATSQKRKIDPGIVSSLFTNNPSSLVHKEEPVAEKLVPDNVPIQNASFDQLHVNQNLVNHIHTKLSIDSPTYIQSSALSYLLNQSTWNSDLFIQAKTGSGKTLAYLLPILTRLMIPQNDKISRSSGLFAIVIVPTRELAAQIYNVLESLISCCHYIVPTPVTGGEKKKSEKSRLRKGVNILIATPGRLVDHLQHTTSLDVSQVRYLVLDEADRLMELGFKPDIDFIISRLTSSCNIRSTVAAFPSLPDRRVTVLCSATLGKDVQELGEQSLQNANTAVDKAESSGDDPSYSNAAAPAQLTQICLTVPAKLRFVTLYAQLLLFAKSFKGAQTKAVVFIASSGAVDFYFKTLARDAEPHESKTASAAYTADVKLGNQAANIYKLHGNMDQNHRSSVMKLFAQAKSAAPQILICTDVASRGLDMPFVDLVIEYDPAVSVDDHLHRVGRTARAGKSGRALLFLLPGAEEAYTDLLKPVHPGGIQTASYDELLKEVYGQRMWQEKASVWQLALENWILEDSKAMSLAKAAFTSHVKAYATHVGAERSIFNVKNLHLGHISKSFGLREAPKAIGKEKNTFKIERKKFLDLANLASKTSASEFNVF
ncbi:hypothetical protein CANCADRAFT_58047 [Tortispora caseinolytica NRRL Y-17796]|uniref:ATP-dependent RNA helicase n=1 Tax=Tortispora caseinolytica NRRL Y-17796 TaxID=767744 RepID=A0A1E4TB79_9ASCO|nr:hypothetical protein CANCADRAFT_58047 [Tortispora caseinolytica NRRL Y-17796]